MTKSGFLSEVFVNGFCITPPPVTGGGTNPAPPTNPNLPADWVWDAELNGYWYANGTMFMPIDGINILPPHPCSFLPLNDQAACYSGQLPSLPPGSVPTQPIVIDPGTIKVPATGGGTYTPPPPATGGGTYTPPPPVTVNPTVPTSPVTQTPAQTTQTSVIPSVTTAGPNTEMVTRFGIAALLVVGVAGYGYYLLKSMKKPTRASNA
jgi:hypothetical protein